MVDAPTLSLPAGRASGTTLPMDFILRGIPVLFSDRSLLTMVHGIGLGGGALLALAAVLFGIYLIQPDRYGVELSGRTGAILPTTAIAASLLWLTTLIGTYIVFPPYRAAPPEGTTDLSDYPRSLLLSNPDNAWLHSFAMETKEHLPFVASMLATAAAFVLWRYRRRFFSDPAMRRLGTAFLLICFGIVAYVSLLGVFVNKLAPLD